MKDVELTIPGDLVRRIRNAAQTGAWKQGDIIWDIDKLLPVPGPLDKLGEETGWEQIEPNHAMWGDPPRRVHVYLDSVYINGNERDDTDSLVRFEVASAEIAAGLGRLFAEAFEWEHVHQEWHRCQAFEYNRIAP